MDFPGAHENDVPGLQGVGFSFDDIIALPLQEQDDLVEIVVMEGDFLHDGIPEPEYTEVLQQVSFFFIFFHGQNRFFL